jgi:outer membrane receptor protein involved in Fe transport
LPNSTGHDAGLGQRDDVPELQRGPRLHVVCSASQRSGHEREGEHHGRHAINLDGAVRYDDYSGNVGATTDPEVNASWAPIDDQFKFRASAGKSFIAPSSTPSTDP